MVVQIDFPTPLRFGVIFIDCWESYTLNPVYRNMQQKLRLLSNRQAENIPARVFASHNHDISKGGVEFSNSVKFFFNKMYGQEFIKSILNDNSGVGYAYTTQMLNDFINESAFLIVSDILFKILLNDKFPTVKDWIVVGGDWQKCYHRRPLGIYRLIEQFGCTDINFYSADWGIIPVVDDPAKLYENDRVIWEHNGEIYRVSKQNRLSKILEKNTETN